MTAYDYDPVTAEYRGDITCQSSPLEPGVYLLPAHATFDAPPDTGEHERAVWTASGWELRPDWRGALYYDTEGNAHTITALGDVKPDDCTWDRPVIVKPPTLVDYENAVQAHIDAVAAENDFDNVLTCAKYIGFDNAFQAHATALLSWNAACWVACHTVMAAVQAGQRQPPTVSELLAEIPAFVWNAPDDRGV